MPVGQSGRLSSPSNPVSSRILRKFIVAGPLLLMPGAAFTQLTWDGEGGDGYWGTGLNWSSDTVPATGDNTAITTNATVTIAAPAQLEQLLMGDGGDTITLNVNDLFQYGDTFGRSDWGTATDNVTVNINADGSVDGSGGGGASRIDGYSTININTAGKLENIYRQRLGVNIVLNGGTFEIDGSDDGTTGTGYIHEAGSIAGPAGTLLFDVAGDGVNDHIRTSSGAVMDLSDLSIVFDVADGYLPQVGHSWDLINDTATSASNNIGDGSNVSTISADGSWEFTYDLSQFANQNKGIVILTGVSPLSLQDEPPILSVIPEQTNFTVKATKTVEFTIRAAQETDEAGQSITLEALSLPPGASFSPNPEAGLTPFEKTFSWTPTASQTGLTTIDFQANDVDGTDSLTIEINVEPPPDPTASYGEFCEAHLEESESNNPAVAGVKVDIEGDGLENIFEYFFQTDPKQPGGRPYSIYWESGQLIVEYTSLKNPADLDVEWQIAQDPGGDWLPSTPSISIMVDHGTTAEYEARFDLSSAREFFRLRLALGEQLLNLPLPKDGTRFESYSEFDGPRWPDTYGEGHVTLWYDGKFAAYSITIDDNNKPDWQWWIDVGNTYGWKFTWFLIIHPYVWDIYNDVPGSNTSYFGALEDFQQLKNAGHDLQLHGSCAQMNNLTATEYEEHILLSKDVLSTAIGAPIFTYAYPCGELTSGDGLHDYRPIIERHFIGARGTQGGVTPVHLLDYLNTKSLGSNALVDGAPKDTFLRVFDGTRPFLYSQYRGWCVTLYHGLDEAGKSAALETFDYVQANEDQFWVAPFTEVAKYAQERESSTLEISLVSADRIEFSLSDRMDDDIFDHPLTVKIRVDASWTDVAATQDGSPVTARIVGHGGHSYVYVEAVPDRGLVILDKI